MPTELKIWITAAQLEESHGNSERAEKVMTRAISDLKQHGVVFGRDKWLEEAHACEREGKSSVVGGCWCGGWCVVGVWLVCGWCVVGVWFVWWLVGGWCVVGVVVAASCRVVFVLFASCG